MSVIHLVLRANTPVSQRVPAGVAIAPCPLPTSLDSVTRLSESCLLNGGYRLNPAGVLAELVSRPGRTVRSWVAFTDGLPVGLVTATEARGRSSTRHSLGLLLVGGNHRRRGIGSALVTTAVVDARRRGAGDVWVETRSDWDAAVAFWQASGFAPATPV